MKSTFEKLLKLDRRIFFILLTLALIIPIIRPLKLPNKVPARDVKKIYNFMENLPAGSFLLVGIDYDPSTRPELHPQATAVIRHAFKRDIRVCVMYFLPAASGIIEELFAEIPLEYSKEYGKDYVILPYQPNYSAVLTQMGTDMYAIYDKDKDGRDLISMPVMKGIKKFRDMDLVMEFTSTDLLDSWVALASDKFGFKLGGGVTAVIQPGYGPYLQTGQLVGLLGGMKGGADYEVLINKPGKGTSGIDALNIAHFLVLGLIVFSNLMIFMLKFL
ncbi:MAG: hypothetical protein ABIG11_10170 [bacterium]